ncbi:MAG: alpha-D-ribose 1-methylphosphonate 5-triphosphate synthase subunit PhnH [Methanolobus sp.]|nr:alpha-D-ribose 1-methylphosphonate 5-triphosphate synthase subunit PhnH [Methanolobus sp.]
MNVRDTGFDIVFDSQNIFRILIDSMAKPGKINELPSIEIMPPVDNHYPFLVLMTLLDREISFTVCGDDAIDLQSVSEYIELNTGSRLAGANNCDFMLVYGGSSNGQVCDAKLGTLRFPDDSSTAVYDVDSISSSGNLMLELTGPGIKDKCVIGIDGIERSEIEDLVSLKEYPLGIDAIFSDKNGKIVCIPRSTNVKVI